MAGDTDRPPWAEAARDTRPAVRERADALRQQTLDSVVDFGVVSTNLDGRIAGWNAGAENVLGWTADEMLGETLDRFFTPEDRAAGRPGKEMRLALEHGRAADERWHVRKSGERFWASGEMMPLRGADGEHLGYVKVLSDRTERHRAGAALREAEARLRRALEAGGIGLFAVDVEADVVAATPEFCRLYGLPERESYPAVEIERLVVPEDGPLASSAASRRRGEAVRDVEFRIRRADTGEERWIARRGGVERDGEGRPVRFAGAVRDVTRRKRLEEELRILNAGLERQVSDRTAERDMMWETSPDLMLIIGFNGVFRRVNPAWTAVLGYRPEDLVGRHVNEFVVPEHHADTVAAYELAAAGGLLTIQNRYRHKDGSVRWISWAGAPVGDVTYATGRDITADKHRQAELERAQEQLRQSQKMEAVGQLTGGIAHDFNNVLQGITGSLEMLETRAAQGRFKDAERYVAVAQGAAKRAAALTHRLLAFSRQQTLDPKPIDTNRLVRGMEDLVRRAVGPAIALEVVTAGGLWPALVDPNQLENALLNLCVNARDAMPDGGRLTVETANRWLDHRAGHERDLPPGQYVSLCVSDTGPGMPPEVAAKAFEPFFTTKPVGQGTGLGLSMVYGFVRQSGGQARIYSEADQGTTVCLYLPRHLGEAEGAEDASAPPEAPRAEAERTVLVVDDEPTVLMLAADVLGNLGYVVVEASDGASALRVLRSDTRIDLLVTDVGLPGGMNGRQLVDAAREMRPGLKVLFITGYAENAVLGNGRLERGMHVMTKPFAMEALAARIKDLTAARVATKD